MSGPEAIADDLLRLRAPNPGPLTGDGTNTYLLPGGIVIDPGPADDGHLAAIEAAGPVRHILVTHSHLDHSPGARVLATRHGAPIYGWGTAEDGLSPTMRALGGTVGGGEGRDVGFAPDFRLTHGEEVEIGGERILPLHTPGHYPNHMCFGWRGGLFSGDHVMGWSTTLISPPDGDYRAFMASLELLAARKSSVFWPGHGDTVTDPAARMAELRAHRLARHAAVAEALAKGPATAMQLVAMIYTDTPKALWPAAARNVLAHLIALVEDGAAHTHGPLTADARFVVGAAP
ncbi:MAG: MBL fold metallo-hydrolase [Shimia sp.]